jgi:hypothetical protein
MSSVLFAALFAIALGEREAETQSNALVNDDSLEGMDHQWTTDRGQLDRRDPTE